MTSPARATIEGDDFELSVAGLRRAFEARTCTPTELRDLLLSRAERDATNAFITIDTAAGGTGFEQGDAEVSRTTHEARPLRGVPVAVKDNFATKGLRTTAGSAALGDWMPEQDASVVHTLRAAGAVILGKTNMDEFAYGPLGTGSVFGPTLNPVDSSRVAGGSSSGSAAAVAAGLCVVALGTDTAGSVRIPASLCGVVGLKPTLGALPCDGTVPLSRSLDHIGILGNSVADVALTWDVLRGEIGETQPRSTPSLDSFVSRDRALALKNVTLGIANYFTSEVQADVLQAFNSAVVQFENLGARIEELSLDVIEDTLPIGAVIVAAEASFYHTNALRRFGDSYGEEVRNRLLAGFAIEAVDYVRATSGRARIAREFHARIRGVDAVISPTTPMTAPRLDELIHDQQAREAARRQVMRFTRPFNVLGSPALTVPCGRDRHDLPIGLQIAGRPNAEDVLLRIGAAFEQCVRPA